MEKHLTLAFSARPSHAGTMPSDRASLNVLKNLIVETDLILETTPKMPQNRTGAARESLKAALGLVNDFIGQQRMTIREGLGALL
jgi:hypothetical protein